MIKFEELQYGFNYGAATVERLHYDAKTNAVTIGLKTPKEDLQIYVTRTGKVRVCNSKGQEWKPKQKGGAQ